MNIQLNVNTRKPAGSGRLLSHEQKLELRAQAVEQIKELIAEKPLSAGEIAELLDLNKSTAYAYLKHMASELRLARRTGQFDEKRRELWELGVDLSLPTKDELLEQCIAPKRPVAPAVQLGMWRDGLVAALFGPALGVAA